MMNMMKDEKIRKMRNKILKMKKHEENSKTDGEFPKISWFSSSHAKSSMVSRIFALVVVTFFDEIFDDFQGFVFGRCFSRRKATTRFGVSPFFPRKVTYFIGRETKTHILPTKINDKKFAEVRPH